MARVLVLAAALSGLSAFAREPRAPTINAKAGGTLPVRRRQPNLVLIVTDDHGYGDLGAHGGEARTPNLDRLGNEGIRLARFYATPVCSVTRATLLTGRNPLRTAVNNARGLDLHEHTLPLSFRAAGYRLSCAANGTWAACTTWKPTPSWTGSLGR